MVWSRVYRIYYDKSRRLSLSSSERKARYLSYIQNSYASVHSFGTPSITLYSVIPLSCPVLSAASVVVAIGLAGSVPIGRGDMYGAVLSVRGPVGVAIRFGVRSSGSEFWVEVWLELGGVTHTPIAFWPSFDSAVGPIWPSHSCHIFGFTHAGSLFSLDRFTNQLFFGVVAKVECSCV